MPTSCKRRLYIRTVCLRRGNTIFIGFFREASRVIASGLARWRRFCNAMLRFSAHARSRHLFEFVSLASTLYGTQPFTAHSPSASGLSSHQAHSIQASPLFLNLTLSSKSRHLTTCDCASLPRVLSAQVAVALLPQDFPSQPISPFALRALQSRLSTSPVTSPLGNIACI